MSRISKQQPKYSNKNWMGMALKMRTNSKAKGKSSSEYRLNRSMTITCRSWNIEREDRNGTESSTTGKISPIKYSTLSIPKNSIRSINRSNRKKKRKNHQSDREYTTELHKELGDVAKPILIPSRNKTKSNYKNGSRREKPRTITQPP